MTSYLLNRITADLFRLYPSDGSGPGKEVVDPWLGHQADDLDQIRFNEQLTPTPAATSDEQADQGGSDSDLLTIPDLRTGTRREQSREECPRCGDPAK
jgi:hypothetical protein